MIVVADTTPLISLMKIGHLDLVHDLFGEIQIPNAVFDELVYNTRFPEESRQIRGCSYIRKVRIEDTRAVELLRRASGLDAGESEAIILSDTIGASFLLMDEVKGRQIAKQMGIQLMGTIGILMTAYKECLLSKEEILNCIEVLKKSGRHISPQLYEQLIERMSD
jgi:predicted nucleic acid-binding protein